MQGAQHLSVALAMALSGRTDQTMYMVKGGQRYIGLLGALK